MALVKVKRFFNPAYSKADWERKNPYLQTGELGIQLDDTGKASQMKIGPGNWNDLPFVEEDIYPYSDLVTNEIGDVKEGEDRSGDLVIDIVKDMISPYDVPALSGAQNDASGGFAGTSIVKIGESVTSQVRVSFVLTAPENLIASNNLFIQAGGVFTNEGFFTYDGGPVTLTLGTPLSPTEFVNYPITIKAIHQQGDSNTVTTTISFQPEMIWGSSDDPSLDENGMSLLANRLTTDDYRKDYAFTTEYSYMGIPVTLNPANVQFGDVTNPNSIQGYAMTDIGVYTVNNGTGTYDYRFYRSDFSLIESTVMRIG
jgi:hypothetical protein